MSKKGNGIRISIGGAGYSIGSAGGYSMGGSGYSLAGSGRGYSLAGSGKGYSLDGKLDSSRTGYSSMTASGYANAGMKMKGYSLRQLYSVKLFPVPYNKLPDPLDEVRRLYKKKKCPMCGKESMSHGYSLN